MISITWANCCIYKVCIVARCRNNSYIGAIVKLYFSGIRDTVSICIVTVVVQPVLNLTFINNAIACSAVVIAVPVSACMEEILL